MEQEKKRDLQLIIYARYNEIKELKKLIAQRVDVDVQDKYGSTALIWASRNGHTEIVKLLTEANPHINGRYAIVV